MDSLNETIAKIVRFRDKRDWRQFHSPKNLSMSIAIEAAELMEHFQWLTVEQAATLAAVLPSPKHLQADRPSEYVRHRTWQIIRQMNGRTGPDILGVCMAATWRRARRTRSGCASSTSPTPRPSAAGSSPAAEHR